MVKAALVEPDLNEGRRLVSALDKAGLPIAIAGWFSEADAEDWQLYVATPDVQIYGPTIVNKFIDRIRLKIESSISLSRITSTNTTNHFLKDIVSFLPPFAALTEGSQPMRFRSGFVGGVNVDGGYIYKVSRNVKPSSTAPRPDEEAIRKARSAAA